MSGDNRTVVGEVLMFHAVIDGQSGPEHEYFTFAAAEVFAVGRGRVVDENGEVWFDMGQHLRAPQTPSEPSESLDDHGIIGGGQGRSGETVANDSRALLVVVLVALFLMMIWWASGRA